MTAYIKAIEYYLPETVVTNSDIAKTFPEWTEESIFNKIGVKQRHIASEDETSLDMAIKAAKKLFSKEESLRDNVDFVLFCTQSSDYKLPTSACIIQSKLCLKNSCGTLDFNLGCSGYVYGLSLAKGLVCSGIANNVLLLTGETYSKYIDKKDKSNISIFGDAASATIIATDGFAEICEFSYGTDGSGFEKLIIKTGGCRFPNQENDSSLDKDGHFHSSDSLFMDGAGIFSFTIKRIPSLIEDILLKNTIEQINIDLFVFHQANAFILEYLRKKLDIPKERFYYCLKDIGNTVSNSIPIALANAYSDGEITKKKKVLIAGFGVGLSWAGCVLNF